MEELIYFNKEVLEVLVSFDEKILRFCKMNFLLFTGLIQSAMARSLHRMFVITPSLFIVEQVWSLWLWWVSSISIIRLRRTRVFGGTFNQTQPTSASVYWAMYRRMFSDGSDGMFPPWYSQLSLAWVQFTGCSRARIQTCRWLIHPEGHSGKKISA